MLVVVFDLWLLTLTYLFFTDAYLGPSSLGARIALGPARKLVSTVILFAHGGNAIAYTLFSSNQAW
jgi:hypothetical protein